MKRLLLALGLGFTLAAGSSGPALAQDMTISPDGPSGIVTMPVERFDANRVHHIYWTNPGYGEPSQGLSAGGPIDNNIGTGHATFSSGDFQGDISEGLSNEGWRFDGDEDQANGGDQPNSPDV
jgi:hypothetical protein